MILLIDLHNLAHRAAHAYEDLWSPNTGKFTGVFYGAFTMLWKYVDELKPTAVWLVSDPMQREHKHSWRKAIHPGYKDRVHKRDEKAQRLYSALQEQLIELKQALLLTNCFWFEQPFLEADDIMARLCQTYKDAKKVVISTDKDLFQLIDQNTSIYYPGKLPRWMTAETFRTESRHLFSANKELPAEQQFTCDTAQWMEYRYMTGDDSDTIDGIPGCGEKTALAVISQEGNYGEWFRKHAALVPNQKKVAKRTIQMLSAEAVAAYNRNIRLMCLSADFSGIPFDISNALCKVGSANFQALEAWMQSNDFSQKDGALISRLRNSPLLEQRTNPYASLRTW